MSIDLLRQWKPSAHEVRCEFAGVESAETTTILVQHGLAIEARVFAFSWQGQQYHALAWVACRRVEQEQA